MMEYSYDSDLELGHDDEFKERDEEDNRVMSPVGEGEGGGSPINPTSGSSSVELSREEQLQFVELALGEELMSEVLYVIEEVFTSHGRGEDSYAKITEELETILDPRQQKLIPSLIFLAGDLC